MSAAAYGGSLFVLGFTVLLSVSWAVVCAVPFGWQKKLNMMFAFDFGLFTADVQTGFMAGVASGMIKAVAPEKAKAIRSLGTGRVSMREIRERICALQYPSDAKQWCATFIELENSGIGLMFAVVLGIALFIVGFGFHYYYWHVKAKEEVRKWSRVWFVAAPTILILGFSQYAYFSSGLRNFPPEGQISYHYAFFFAGFLCLVGWVPLLADRMFMGTAEFEAINEVLRDQRKEAMMAYRDELRTGYGATGAQTAKAYGAYPPMDPGGVAFGGQQFDEQTYQAYPDVETQGHPGYGATGAQTAQSYGAYPTVHADGGVAFGGQQAYSDNQVGEQTYQEYPDMGTQGQYVDQNGIPPPPPPPM